MKYFLSLALFAFIFSCTKGPGTGGRAEIKGTVFAYNYNDSYQLQDTGYIGGEKVFIVYGDEQAISDNVDTDYKGQFTFNYLRQGKYKIYVYTNTLQNNKLDTAIVQEVEITDRNQILELPRFNINTLKN